MKIDEYSMPLDEVLLICDIEAASKKPLKISLRNTKTKGVLTLQYSTYESVPFDANTFAVPKTAEIQEVTTEQIKQRNQKALQKPPLGAKPAALGKPSPSQSTSTTPNSASTR